MKKLLGFFFLMFTVTCLKAQNCNCGDNFAFLTQRISKNYVGYTDKITPSNSKQFAKFTDSLQQIANRSNAYQCLSLCREWLDFFKDKHLAFGMAFDELNADSVRTFFSDEEKTKWTDSSFKSYLLQNKAKLDPVEGIWSTGIYEVGIVKDIKPNQFIAFVLKADSVRWMPQQVKFRIMKKGGQYQTIYFSGGDHSEQHPALIKNADTLDFGFFKKWVKVPKPLNATIEKEIDLSPKFRVLNDETAIFEMPSFGKLDYVAPTAALIKKNESVLKNMKHLIIDLRNNSGGSVLVYEKLMPYLYTNPILKEGGYVLATAENIRDGYSKEYPEVSDSIRNVLKKNLMTLKAHEGELYKLYPVDTIKFNTVYKNPERISFLVNKNTGSAAELFLLEAKQSKKVKIYGENSSGTIDYVEVITTKMPCNFYTLYYPACKSFRLPDYPLDNIGIKPDVEIPDSVTDWIDFVKNHQSK
ncbi:S41 family peptidase [Pedobacter sp. GR22-10]|uniref:S41 family peptidase n=1 Tax=Pedobacter sp. GR22-10 TaxID=2994472 RepID=UPI002247BD98|nr:S41 family peptidase [Pedobacter sp. GR22-10]MCX2432658.1 S41 family peptidase [Pedobacter sp. GR22-10]